MTQLSSFKKWICSDSFTHSSHSLMMLALFTSTIFYCGLFALLRWQFRRRCCWKKQAGGWGLERRNEKVCWGYNIFLTMKKTKKVIENYQIIDTLEEYQNEYEILLAKHTTEKKYYVLKKLSIKQGNNQALYQGLLNQAKLLKLLNHDNIVKCYRMLKTSNNIYLAYTYLEGSTLEDLLEDGPKSLTFAQKESIAKQLCLILSELQKSDIAHLNITPENIIVNKDSVIMLREFIYGMEIPEQGEIDVQRKVPKSIYVSPEVRRGIACFESDIYSVGKVFEKLEFKKNKKDPNSTLDNSKKIQSILNLVELMTIKERSERISLNEVYLSLFPSKKKVKRLRSLSQSGMQNSYLSSSSVSSSKSQFGSKQIYELIIKKILRHRNISWFLLKLFKRVVTNVKLNSDNTVILGVILLKKSTKMLAGLGKYLHYGKNDIGIDINSKDQTRFFKTTDHHKMCEIIDKEIVVQKKDLQTAIETVYLNNSGLLKKPQFSREIKEQQTNQKYFQKCIKDYLTQLISNSILSDLSDEVLFDLYLMSLIVYFQGVQEFFKQRILIEPFNFDEQLFIKKAKRMPKEKLIETLKENLEPRIAQI